VKPLLDLMRFNDLIKISRENYSFQIGIDFFRQKFLIRLSETNSRFGDEKLGDIEQFILFFLFAIHTR
jgi:hypothetical protein